MAFLKVEGSPKWDCYYALVDAMDKHRISSSPMIQLNEWMYSKTGYEYVDISTFNFTQNDLERLKHADFDFYRKYISSHKN